MRRQEEKKPRILQITQIKKRIAFQICEICGFFFFFVCSWLPALLRLLLPIHQQQRNREQLQHDGHEKECLEIERLRPI